MSLTSKRKWATEGGLGPIGGSPPEASSAPAAPGESSVEEFMNHIGTSLAQLQNTVADLVDRTNAVPTDVDGSPMAVDPEVTEVSRTLVLARRTADATLAEAREEAATMLADAERSRDQIIGEARARADEEYTAQRELALSESRRWEERKAQLTRQFEALDVELGAASARLNEMQEAVRSALAGADAMTATEPTVTEAAVAADAPPVETSAVESPPPPPEPQVGVPPHVAGPQPDPEFAPPPPQPHAAQPEPPLPDPPVDAPADNVVPPLTDTPFAPGGNAFSRRPEEPAEQPADAGTGDDGYYRRGLFGR